MKFTVAIPAFKRRYLRECIDSVLAQTYNDFEVVIVNDASPENLDEIILSYDNPKIRYYVNSKNSGVINVVDNWNICLDYANGDYLILMGDDDRLLPHCLEEYSRLIDRYPGLGLYHGWTEIIDEDSKFLMLQEARPQYEGVYSMIWHRWHGRTQFIGDFLFEISLLRSNGGFYKLPMAWGSDDISAVMAASRGGVANTQVLVFQYRVSPLTISSIGDVDVKMNAVSMEKMWYGQYLLTPPTDSVEAKYQMLCRNGFCKNFIKKHITIIAADLSVRPSRFFHWLKKRTNYRISIGMLLYAFMESLKKRQLRKRVKMGI